MKHFLVLDVMHEQDRTLQIELQRSGSPMSFPRPDYVIGGLIALSQTLYLPASSRVSFDAKHIVFTRTFPTSVRYCYTTKYLR